MLELILRDITQYAMCSAQPGAQHGKRPRRCLWAAAARAQAARRGGAPCSATTPGRGEAGSGIGTTGYEKDNLLDFAVC